MHETTTYITHTRNTSNLSIIATNQGHRWKKEKSSPELNTNIFGKKKKKGLKFQAATFSHSEHPVRSYSAQHIHVHARKLERKLLVSSS